MRRISHSIRMRSIGLVCFITLEFAFLSPLVVSALRTVIVVFDREHGRSPMVSFESGRIMATVQKPEPIYVFPTNWPAGIHVLRAYPMSSLDTWPPLTLRNGHVSIPLVWPNIGLGVVGTAIVSLRSRHQRCANLCPRCKYNPDGLASATCPECGRPVTLTP